jgi:purine nucleoside phosphorylase
MATKILMATTSRYPETNIQLANALDTAASFIKQRLGKSGISIVLGSGLGNFANRLDNRASIPYDEIPFMPRTTVEGHSTAGEVDFTATRATRTSKSHSSRT